VRRLNRSSNGAAGRRAGNGALALSPLDAFGLEERLAPVAMAFPQPPARPELWQRIEAAVDAAQSSGPPAIVVRREEGWRQYTRDVQIKRLWDANTYLLRCAPGGVLPAHKHPRFEHCVILEGDMIVSGETYRSGDYHGVPPHVAHQEISSRTGLLMLVRYQ
jgi:mannose-6-phosphate isomerase-like protein (cupin superfamily)